jgi:hypothetical protein
MGRELTEYVAGVVFGIIVGAALIGLVAGALLMWALS